jgi:hypothetical protein
LDLIVVLDEASSEIYSALLVEEEGAASSFQAERSELRRSDVLVQSRPEWLDIELPFLL